MTIEEPQEIEMLLSNISETNVKTPQTDKDQTAIKKKKLNIFRNRFLLEIKFINHIQNVRNE